MLNDQHKAQCGTFDQSTASGQGLNDREMRYSRLGSSNGAELPSMHETLHQGVFRP
ncbi:MAG: hypothetical protein PF961_08790 [Planctomycetota bacterium]|nr:hypothetical protein [Planctomycetota bacterium]